VKEKYLNVYLELPLGSGSGNNLNLVVMSSGKKH